VTNPNFNCSTLCVEIVLAVFVVRAFRKHRNRLTVAGTRLVSQLLLVLFA
jgi:hypothetical protein